MELSFVNESSFFICIYFMRNMSNENKIRFMKYTSLILYLLYNIIKKYYSDGEINKKIGDKNMRAYDNIDALLKRGSISLGKL